jgi:hypothetical protein
MKKRMFLATVLVCVFVFGAGNVYAQADYKDFSSGERVGTWALNAWVFPGLGSFVLMNDWVGGGIQMGAGLVGDICAIMGMVEIYRYMGVLDDNYQFRYDPESSNYGNRATWDRAIALLITGSVVVTASSIFNIIRSVTYHKPIPELAILNPGSWNLAVLPGRDGIESVSLSYTIRY